MSGIILLFDGLFFWLLMGLYTVIILSGYGLLIVINVVIARAIHHWFGYS